MAAADSVHVALNVSVPLLPATVFAVVAMLPEPLALSHAPAPEAAQVHEQLVSAAGNVSLTATFVTATVAGFVTLIV